MNLMKAKVVIITGITKGIGEKTALKMAENGLNIVGSYLQDNESARLLQKSIEQFGVKCILIEGDLRKKKVVKKIIDTAIQVFGKVDFLINNASNYERLEINQVAQQQFLNMFKLNVLAPFMLSKGAAPFMKKEGFGKIINISSAIAKNGYNYSCHYTSTKFALEGLTRSLAMELAPEIRVNCVAPGFLNISNSQEIDYFESRIKKIPLMRLGDTDDIVNMIDFLVSDKSDYITGQVITVSGGF